MNEKLSKSVASALVLVFTGEAAALGIHYQHNAACRAPVDQTGCLPTTPGWLLNPHPERDGNHTVSSFATSTTASSSGTPLFGITGVGALQEAADRSR